MPDLKLSYIILFEDGAASSINTIRVEDSLDLAEVRRKIYEEEFLRDRRIPLSEISIYTPPELNAAPSGTLVDRVKTSVEGSDPTSPLDEVSSIFPRPKFVHLVLVARPPAITGPQHDTGMPVEDPEVLSLYRDIIIKVGQWGDYTEDDVIRNDIREATEIPVPKFVTDFEEKLDSNPYMLEAFKVILGDQYDAAYFGSLINSNAAEEQSGAPAAVGEETAEADDEDHNNRTQPWRQADRLELMHIAEIASEDWQTFWTGDLEYALKGDIANAIFFLKLMLHIPKGRRITAVRNKPQITLVVEIANGEGLDLKERYRTYKPVSDFLIMKSKLPRQLTEVDSTGLKTGWPVDKARMFLAGAAFVRFANAFLDAFKLRKNFVLVTNFLRGNGRASRYTLFQRPDDRTVYWRERRFELTTPIGRVDFARQLYNHLHMLHSSLEEEEDTQKKTEELKSKIEMQAKKFAMKSVHTRGTKRKHEPDNGNNNVAGGGGGGGGANTAAAAAELRAHGYEVKPEVIWDASGGALEPLFKMPSHILTVYRPSDPSTEFIAKEVDEESNELQILADIRRLSPASNHVISLLDSFPGQAGAWAILPKIPNSLADYLALAPDELRGNVVEICLGLIEGLTYLHENLFAHRDIKPANLLVDRYFCLKIIDFDVAVRLRYEGEKVTGYCGTAGWMAPEVEKGLEYDPIKADCWSCGCVILHLFDRFKESDESLRIFAEELKANDPRDRPQLREWGAPPSPLSPGPPLSRASSASPAASPASPASLVPPDSLPPLSMPRSSFDDAWQRRTEVVEDHTEDSDPPAKKIRHAKPVRNAAAGRENIRGLRVSEILP